MGLSSPTYQVGAWKAGDSGITDANGTTWGISRGGTSGVFDGPDIRLNQSPFPNADGAQRSRNFRLPRVMVLSGWARGSSVAGTEASRRAFTGMLGDGEQDTMTVTFLDGLVATALVERGAQPKSAPASPVEFDWQFTFSAVDPSLHGPQSSQSTSLPVLGGALHFPLHFPLHFSGTAPSNGLVEIVNPGTAESWPNFTITAGSVAVSGILIVNTDTGETLGFTRSLNPGDVVNIVSSPLRRRVRLNEVPGRRFLSPAQWFSVPAVGSITVQFIGTSTSPSVPQLVASLAPDYQ